MLIPGFAALSADSPSHTPIRARADQKRELTKNYGRNPHKKPPADGQGLLKETHVATHHICAPEGIRTPNLLIRSQMLYPLSYGRNSVPDRSPVHCGRSGEPLANHVRDYMMQSGAANPSPTASGE